MKQLRRLFGFSVWLLFAAGCGGSLFLSEDSRTSASKQRRRAEAAQLSTKPEMPPPKRTAVPLDSPLRTTVPAGKEEAPPPLLKPTELSAKKEAVRLVTAPVPLERPVEEARLVLPPIPLTAAETEAAGGASDLKEPGFRRIERAPLALRPDNLSGRQEAASFALQASDLDERKAAAGIVLRPSDLDGRKEEARLALPLAALDRKPEPVSLVAAPAEIAPAEISTVPLAFSPNDVPINKSLREEASLALSLERKAAAVREEAPLAVAATEKAAGELEEASLALQAAEREAETEAASFLQTDLNMKPVFFDVDSSELLEEGLWVLNENVKRLESYPYRFNYIVLEGHCDPLGSEDYNLKLGRERAEAVKQYLQDRGIPEELLVTVSYGESRLLSEADDAQNRRVSFTVIH